MRLCSKRGDMVANGDHEDVYTCHQFGICTLKPCTRITMRDGSPVPHCHEACVEYVPTIQYVPPKPEVKVNPHGRHLIYHIWPRRGAVWKWNVEQLLQRIGQFDGVITIGIVIDDSSEFVETVKAAFGNHRVDNWVIAQNKSDVGEAATFYDMLRTLPKTGRTFYGHAKGVRHEGTPQEAAVRKWAGMMYLALLDGPELIDECLKDYPTVGTFKMHFNGPSDWKFCDIGPCDWQFAGTFLWFRNTDVFAKPVEAFHWNGTYWAIEQWISQMFTAEQGMCLLGERPRHQYTVENFSYYEDELRELQVRQNYSWVGGSDKTTVHSYGGWYREHLNEYRDNPVVLLEIGVQGGHSLHMWDGYFTHPQARFVGVDKSAANASIPSRATVIHADGTHRSIVERIPKELDIVIDDGAHSLRSQIDAMRIYWNRLNPGGLYVIEDVQTDANCAALKLTFPLLNETDLRSIKGRWDDRILWAIKSDSNSFPERKKFAYFTGTNRNDKAMIDRMIKSARDSGVMEDFHVFAPFEAINAINHHIDWSFNWRNYMGKIDILRKMAEFTEYEYVCWLDSDNHFVRDPGDLSDLMRDNKCWALMEEDLRKSVHPDWWGLMYDQKREGELRTGQLIDLMSELSDRRNLPVWGTNAGMFIVRVDAIHEFADRCERVFGLLNGLRPTVTEEPPLAVLAQTGDMVSDPENNTFEKTKHIWACDWQDLGKKSLPNGDHWLYKDWITQTEIGHINPAICHLMKQKGLLAGIPAGAKEPVGTRLREILEECGIGRPSCGVCASFAAWMDQIGLDGCKTNRTAILTRLEQEKQNANWIQWVKVAAKGYLSCEALLDEAIKRATP